MPLRARLILTKLIVTKQLNNVTKTTLTLGKKEDDQLSQWQYNKVFAYGDHFTSKDFYYQIAKGGQGEVKQKMTFKEIK